MNRRLDGDNLAEREVALIEKAALSVGMKSLMNHGAASCVYSEGCNGVTQSHLIAFAREVALHCVAALSPSPSGEAAETGSREALANWVAERWHAEVENRPLVNVHRRSLDGTWRQMLRHLGVDDRARLGPTHDELLGQRQPEPDDTPLETGEGDAR